MKHFFPFLPFLCWMYWLFNRYTTIHTLAITLGSFLLQFQIILYFQTPLIIKCKFFSFHNFPICKKAQVWHSLDGPHFAYAVWVARVIHVFCKCIQLTCIDPQIQSLIFHTVFVHGIFVNNLAHILNDKLIFLDILICNKTKALTSSFHLYYLFPSKLMEFLFTHPSPP
jgi:hypothetical protein